MIVHTRIQTFFNVFPKNISGHCNNGNLRKQIPIVAMTANVFKEDIEKCLSAGMDSHIGKPFNLDDVLEKIKAFMKK